MTDTIISDEDEIYTSDELHAMILAAAQLATVVAKADAKHGAYSSLTLSLRAAWAVLDEEIECNASPEDYDSYQRAMGNEPVAIPNHPGTDTPQ